MRSPKTFLLLVPLLLGFAICSGSGADAQDDLARAYRIISSKRFVDLTHAFGPDSPVWSGFGQARAACTSCHEAEKLGFMNNQPLFRRTERPKE